jgi:hypothetical protein
MRERNTKNPFNLELGALYYFSSCVTPCVVSSSEKCEQTEQLRFFNLEKRASDCLVHKNNELCNFSIKLDRESRYMSREA